MKSHLIKITSKNKKSILKFLFLVHKKFNFKIGSKALLKNYLPVSNRKKIITVLKSPHVNKKAQEQFETRIFSQKLVIYTAYDNRFLYFLKNLKLRLFPDIRLKIKFITNRNSSIKKQIFNLYNYKFQPSQFYYSQDLTYQNKKTNFKENFSCISKLKDKSYKMKNLKRSIAYLNIIGIYGKLFLKQLKVWIAQLVEQRTENPCVSSSILLLNKNLQQMKNYLWNMFANIKNAQLAKRDFIFQEKKHTCESFLKILWNEGFILGYKTDITNNRKLKIFLKYQRNKPAINSLKTISKPGRRIYYSIKQIWKIDSNKSFIIFSTNKGLKTITDCKKLGIGGEPFVVIN